MPEQENNPAVAPEPVPAAHPRKKERFTQNKIYRLIGEVDRPFLIVVIALVCLGSVMVFSASYAVCKTRFGDSYLFARRQLVFVGLGIVTLAFVARFDYRVLKRFAYIGYVVTLGLNFLVRFFGETKNGATRWFSIMGVEFQPSELLKFFLVLSMATYISNHQRDMRSIRKGVLPLVMLGVPAALATFTQNHLSATIIMLMLTFVMVWLSGCKGSYLGIVAGAAALMVVFVLTLGIGLIEKFVPHAFTRIQIWQDPFAYMSYDTGGKGWQPAQSLYAISSGGFWGLGLGRSNQKHGFLRGTRVLRGNMRYRAVCGFCVARVLYREKRSEPLLLRAHARDSFAGRYSGYTKPRRRYQHHTEHRHKPSVFQLRRNLAYDTACRNGHSAFDIALFLYRTGLNPERNRYS